MATATRVSSFLRAVQSLSPFRRLPLSDDHRLLVCGPHVVLPLMKETFSSNFKDQAVSLETLNISRLRGAGAGFCCLSVAMNDAFILVFFMDDEDCFQSISAFREVIVSAKGEDVPLLVVAYNRLTSEPRIMGPETADCLMTIEWGVGYVEATTGRPGDLELAFEEIFKIIRKKVSVKRELQRMQSA